MPKVLVTLSDDALAILDEHAGPRARSALIERLVLAIKKKAPQSESVDAPRVIATVRWPSPERARKTADTMDERKPLGSMRRVMGKDPKSAAPIMLRRETLVRYDGDEPVWETVK